MSIEIVYETHATTTDNETGIATGWLPGRLSEAGRKQASELGRRRREDNIAAVFVSDLWRAVETAESAFAASGIPIYQDIRLRECNYGERNGTSVTRLATERSRRIDDPYPGGQSYRQAADEMRNVLCDLARVWDGKRVVIIAHSANKWALDHLINGAALEDLVDAPFAWHEGWLYLLPTGWPGATVSDVKPNTVPQQPVL